MKAIISSNPDPLYQFFIPITTWCWNKLAVDVICFVPEFKFPSDIKNRPLDILRIELIYSYIRGANMAYCGFGASSNKEATYAQCSRLFAHTVDEVGADEHVIVGDVDMLMFRLPNIHPTDFCVFGSDLTPEKQYPMCYISAPKNKWHEAFGSYGDSLQKCLDNILGHENCENMRGNLWARDQEFAYNVISRHNPVLVPRAREGTQFASNRIDRDDAFFLDRLTPDIIDYHAHRPGYTPENVEKIISVMAYFYPNEDLTWVREYANEYRKLLGI